MEAAATGVAGQLLLLESKLNERGSAKIDDGNDGSSAVEERLASLLQVRWVYRKPLPPSGSVRYMWSRLRF